MNESKHDRLSKRQITTDEVLNEMIKIYGHEVILNVLTEVYTTVRDSNELLKKGKLVGEP